MNRVPSTVPNAGSGNDPLANSFDSIYGVNVYTASGAISQKEGKVLLNAASALAMTLVAPTAGLPSAGGDDGKTLIVVDISGHAHTITTPSNAINGSKHVATFSGTEPAFQNLLAYNGTWWSEASSNITLS